MDSVAEKILLKRQIKVESKMDSVAEKIIIKITINLETILVSDQDSKMGSRIIILPSI